MAKQCTELEFGRLIMILSDPTKNQKQVNKILKPAYINMIFNSCKKKFTGNTLEKTFKKNLIKGYFKKIKNIYESKKHKTLKGIAKIIHYLEQIITT